MSLITTFCIQNYDEFPFKLITLFIVVTNINTNENYHDGKY